MEDWIRTVLLALGGLGFVFLLLDVLPQKGSPLQVLPATRFTPYWVILWILCIALAVFFGLILILLPE